MTAPSSMNSFRGKQVLALIRAGDYAHAGEEEAIELTMAAISKKPDQRIFDAGCGRGGTAAYLLRQGWGQATGFDVEVHSIENARERYPEPRFIVCGIDEAGDRLDRIYDVITLLNVLHDLADHTRALASLAKTALPGARLAVFDYLDRGDCQASALADADGPLVPYPLKRADVEGTLGPQAGGWRACRRSMQTTVRWYVAFAGEIEAKREAIEGRGRPRRLCPCPRVLQRAAGSSPRWPAWRRDHPGPTAGLIAANG